MVLLAYTICCCTGTHLPCRFQYGGKIEVFCLRRTKLLINLKHISASDHFIDSAETKFRHISTQFLCKVVEEVDDLLRLTRKLGPKLGVLRRNTDRTCVH